MQVTFFDTSGAAASVSAGLGKGHKVARTDALLLHGAGGGAHCLSVIFSAPSTALPTARPICASMASPPRTVMRLCEACLDCVSQGGLGDWMSVGCTVRRAHLLLGRFLSLCGLETLLRAFGRFPTCDGSPKESVQEGRRAHIALAKDTPE